MVWQHRIKRTCDSLCNTLTGRLIAGIVVIHGMLLPLFFGAVLFLIKESHESQFVEYARSSAALYARMIRPGDPESALKNTLDDILLSGQVNFVELERHDGRLLRSSLGKQQLRFQEDFFFGQHDDQTYFIAVPVSDNEGATFALLRLGFSEQLTLEQIAKAYRRTLLISAMYFLLSALFVSLVSILITRSIRQIANTSRAIAQGELERPFSLRTSIGEIRQLTSNLEHMRQALLRDRQEIQDREARIHAIVENMAEGVITIDEHGMVENFNQAAERIFGYRAEEVIGRNVSLLMPKEIGARHSDYIRRYLATGKAKIVGQGPREVTGRHKDGLCFPVELSVSELVVGGRRVFSGILRDITERVEQQNLLEYQATHDPLTGLPNRTLCLDRLQQMLALSRREQGHSALLLVDLNLFKEVNDNYGHDYGDAVLKEVAHRLVEITRHSDTVARFGGDEFIILLPGQDDTGAAAVARNILDTIAKPIVVKDERLGVGASIGIAIFPQHGDSEQELIRNADQAMYKAKRHHLGFHLCGSDTASSRN